jgi:DNA-binding GntR family transcriptional regulator
MYATPRLQAIDSESMLDRVVQRLRDGIIQGALPPGAPLRIDRLASDLGVSHMPVREALHVLTVEGLAVRLPRRGVRVSALSAEDLKSAYEAMAAIEGLAGRIAAQNLSARALGELREVLAPALALVAASDWEALLRVNREFHARIYAACRNRWVSEFCRQLWNYVYRLRRRYPQSARRQQEAVDEHLEILEALAAHAGDRADALIRGHCVRSRDDLLDQLAAARVPGFEGESGDRGTGVSKSRSRSRSKSRSKSRAGAEPGGQEVRE